MDFLPQGYDVPEKGGSYMKLTNGVNHFRILQKPILGFETWIQEGDKKKPLRYQMNETFPTEYADTLKHFWAMPVWNYKESKIQILSITQKTILRAIKGLANDPDWGSPLEYDLVINRTGEDLQSTEYTVQPKPKKELPEEAKAQWEKMTIDMALFYHNGDPFSINSQPKVTTADGDINIEALPF